MPLRGAKFGTFEGSFRTAAFVHAPHTLLPAALVGKETDALVYVGDWYPTVLGLAGVPPDVVAQQSGPVPLDTFDVWAALTQPPLAPQQQQQQQQHRLGGADGADGLLAPTTAASPRTMIVHEYDQVQGIFAIRVGDYKLVWGKVGVADWIEDVSYENQSCALLPPARGVSGSGSDTGEGTAARDNASAAAEAVVASGDGKSGILCTEAAPCLFDVVADPTEHTQLNTSNFGNYSAVVVAMKAKLAAYVARRWNGTLDTAATTEDAYCAWIKDAKWVQPYEPLPPTPPTPAPRPVPPGVAAQLNGTWDQHAPGSSHEWMSLVITNASHVRVAGLNCTGCCWQHCDGIATPGPQGGAFSVQLLRHCDGKADLTQHGVLGVNAQGRPTLTWSGKNAWKSWTKVDL